MTDLCPNSNPNCQFCAVKDLEAENANLRRELAEARAIGELERAVVESRMAQFIAIDERARLIALRKTIDACVALLGARAATGEPKETT